MAQKMKWKQWKEAYYQGEDFFIITISYMGFVHANVNGKAFNQALPGNWYLINVGG